MAFLPSLSSPNTRSSVSDRIYASAIIVSDYSSEYSHWNACESLADWLKREGVPGITGIDTRELTKVLREHGVMMGKIVFDDEPDNIPEAQYSGVNYVAQVSCKDIIKYNEGAPKKVVLVDCGVKNNIIRCLIKRNVEVIRVPWNYDFNQLEFDGLFLANGPRATPTRASMRWRTSGNFSTTPLCVPAWAFAWATSCSRKLREHVSTS